MTQISPEYFRKYRQMIGFNNQSHANKFLGAKDITPTVDLNYIALLNKRLSDMIDAIYSVIPKEISPKNVEEFKQEKIYKTFEILNDNNILPNLNNQGRRPENVYFNWMRGYVISEYFVDALGYIFDVDVSNIDLIGDDDLKNIETFKRTPKADLQINLKDGQKIRIEMQAGFTGINDIKEHKVREAKRVFKDVGNSTLVIHIDLYNGQVAFVRVDQIDEKNINWVIRTQMEGQTVFNINQDYFIWKITELPPKYKDLNL